MTLMSFVYNLVAHLLCIWLPINHTVLEQGKFLYSSSSAYNLEIKWQHPFEQSRMYHLWETGMLHFEASMTHCP